MQVYGNDDNDLIILTSAGDISSIHSCLKLTDVLQENGTSMKSEALPLAKV